MAETENRGGHAKKPVLVKMQNKTFNVTRDSKRIPQPKVNIEKIPDPPKGLSVRAKKVWVDLLNSLEEVGLLRSTDMLSLELLIHNLDRYWKIEAEIKAYEKEHGGKISKFSPKRLADWKVMMSVSKNTLGTVVNLGKQFGLSPHSRRGLIFDIPEDPQDEVEDLVG